MLHAQKGRQYWRGHAAWQLHDRPQQSRRGSDKQLQQATGVLQGCKHRTAQHLLRHVQVLEKGREQGQGCHLQHAVQRFQRRTPAARYRIWQLWNLNLFRPCCD